MAWSRQGLGVRPAAGLRPCAASRRGLLVGLGELARSYCLLILVRCRALVADLTGSAVLADAALTLDRLRFVETIGDPRGPGRARRRGPAPRARRPAGAAGVSEGAALGDRGLLGDDGGVVGERGGSDGDSAEGGRAGEDQRHRSTAERRDRRDHVCVSLTCRDRVDPGDRDDDAALPQGPREETAREAQGSGAPRSGQRGCRRLPEPRGERGLGPLVGADDDHPRPAERERRPELAGGADRASPPSRGPAPPRPGRGRAASRTPGGSPRRAGPPRAPAGRRSRRRRCPGRRPSGPAPARPRRSAAR